MNQSKCSLVAFEYIYRTWMVLLSEAEWKLSNSATAVDGTIYFKNTEMIGCSGIVCKWVHVNPYEPIKVSGTFIDSPFNDSAHYISIWFISFFYWLSPWRCFCFDYSRCVLFNISENYDYLLVVDIFGVREWIFQSTRFVSVNISNISQENIVLWVFLRVVFVGHSRFRCVDQYKQTK